MADMLPVEKLLLSMKTVQAATLHLKTGQPPMVRIGEEIKSTQGDALTEEQVREMLFSIMSPEQQRTFAEKMDLDFSHECGDEERFRINVYLQRGHVSAAARRVNAEIPTFEQLHLPKAMEKIAAARQGLIVITGVTGSGKSTTLAAVLEFINQRRRCNIVTIEDPIEYSFKDKKAIVNQREIHIDVSDFHEGLKHVLRQDPDVILLGEMRDSESFQAGLQAAETGHLVLGTLHSSTVAQTMGRILEFFPADRESQVRRALEFNLKAIVCQKLLPSIKEGVQMVPATEILVATPTVRKLIHDGEDGRLPDAIRGDTETGMMDFNQSLAALVRAELVDRRVALSYSDSPEALRREFSGIAATGGILGA